MLMKMNDKINLVSELNDKFDEDYDEYDDLDEEFITSLNKNYNSYLIKELINSDIKGHLSMVVKPIKIKKSFKLRRKEFFTKIKNKILMVFGE